MANLEKYIENGVVFIDTNSAWIDDGVVIGSGTVIEPNVMIKGDTVIGENVTIGFCSEIVNSKIGDNVTIKHSVITDSTIGKGTNVGPFAYVRPNCVVGENVKIGDFVEIKNSNIDDGTKLAHLTYVGDADVGKNINFGCGTVVVNYDGKQKHRTVIGDNAFIGCNTNLVSPVKVGKNAFTAAGSTITEDVPDNALAVARERQTVKEDWVTKRG
jgi:bifunctional UDP-N-acetylglucosamine pyrophosphorylase/glucosamine-1-phosphate N-acetyltransferase